MVEFSDRNLAKAILKAWLDQGYANGANPSTFMDNMQARFQKYAGNCPLKLLTFMLLVAEVTQELLAEENGDAVPNVKPQTDSIGRELGGYGLPRRTYPDWD